MDLRARLDCFRVVCLCKRIHEGKHFDDVIDLVLDADLASLERSQLLINTLHQRLHHLPDVLLNCQCCRKLKILLEFWLLGGRDAHWALLFVLDELVETLGCVGWTRVRCSALLEIGVFCLTLDLLQIQLVGFCQIWLPPRHSRGVYHLHQVVVDNKVLK